MPKDSEVNARRGKIPIGFQLYTARGEFSRNVPRTIKNIGAMGYAGVEFWNYAGTAKGYKKYSTRELREMLEENQIKCCGIHLKLKALAPHNLERTIENSQVLGN